MSDDKPELPDDPIDQQELPDSPPRLSPAEEDVVAAGADASVGAGIDEQLDDANDDAAGDDAHPV